MDQGRIVIITGCPGTGKTTVASAVAAQSAMERSVHMHTDDFYGHLCKGAIAPYLPESHTQNEIVIEAFLAAAMRYARGGYDVIVDGVIGPWMLTPWLAAAQEGCPVHYIVLRASEAVTMQRALGREKLDHEANARLVQVMWPQFANLGAYEPYALDTTCSTAGETAQAVLRILGSQSHRLPSPR